MLVFTRDRTQEEMAVEADSLCMVGTQHQMVSIKMRIQKTNNLHSRMKGINSTVYSISWYDVTSFVTHRMFESGDPEVPVRFAGFGAEEDEWVNVRKCVRHRSLPCESSECVAVLPGDLILCFQHFESFVREHFHQRGHYILGACNAYMMGAQVGCLSGEAMMGVHGRADTQSTSSIGFKIMLAKLIPKLVSAFKEVGADCEEFVNASEHFGHVEKATI